MDEDPPPAGAARVADEVVGAQIRTVRTERGISLRGLARSIDVSPATMSQIEHGRTGLSVARLDRIAQAMGVSVPRILAVTPGADAAAEPEAGPDPVSPAGPHGASADWRVYEPPGFDPVLAAALDEFVLIGYHGATVRGIAARAGLSVSGIYHYYAGKQHMLVAILEFAMVELLWRARAARAEGEGPVERFSLLIEHLALFHTHRAEIGFVGATEMRSLAPESFRRIAALRTWQQRLVDREAADAVAAGRFRADQAHERARAAVTMCTALPTWWRPGGLHTPERIAEQYVGFALDLMRRPSG